MHLQELLGVAPDGDFGPALKAKVVAFQKKAGLYADGIVGRQSWELLLAAPATKPASAPASRPAPTPASSPPERNRPPLRLGDTGDDVEYLQGLLKVSVDGHFGPGTKQAVLAFQKSHKLAADGIVGAGTWKALLN